MPHSQVHLRMAEEALTDEMAESRERERRRLEEVQVASLPKRRVSGGVSPGFVSGGGSGFGPLVLRIQMLNNPGSFDRRDGRKSLTRAVETP